MTEFEEWKNEVAARLVEEGIPVDDTSLVHAWNVNHSVEYTVMAEKAEYLSYPGNADFTTVKRCGCFRCTKFFLTDEIEWDGGANCPYCGCDSVLPDTEEWPLTAEMLAELAEKQFANYPSFLYG